jgi:selenophosphate synthetase-related protein
VANEFALISRYFKRAPRRARLGVGDDCALLDVPTGQSLAISTDMLVAGQHFFPDTDPYRLGRKSLAVNLSDLAACAALPRHALLSLALPEANDAWLAAFSEGFWSLADAWDVELIGGIPRAVRSRFRSPSWVRSMHGMPCVVMRRETEMCCGYPVAPAKRRWAWLVCRAAILPVRGLALCPRF